MEGVIEERQKKIVEKLNLKKNWYWFVLAAIAWLGYWIRTRNLPLLVDITTGKYFPADPDAASFLRYAKYILENGSLMTVDYMRYYPWGYLEMIEFKVLSYAIVYFYKFLHFFNPAMTLEKADVIYPPIAFVIGLIFFFLLVKKLFDYRIALVSSLLLTIIPMYLFRTIAGVGDKEAFSMIFFFASLYFFLIGWGNLSWKYNIFFGGISGIITGSMTLIWGGVQFIIFIIGIFTLISLFFIKFRNNNFITYFSWLVLTFVLLNRLRDNEIYGLVTGFHTGFVFFVLICAIIYYLLFIKNMFKLKDKINGKFPLGISALVIGIVAGSVLFTFIDPKFLVAKFTELYIILTNPFGQSRWALTVAEAHQPYLIEWLGQTSWKYIWMVLIGSIWMFYEASGKFLNKKNRIIGTALYSFMLFGLVFNRYSPNSVLNGQSSISKWFYFGSFTLFVLVFLWYYLYVFKKDKELFSENENFNEYYILTLIWLFIMLIGARSASRLLFVLAPIISITAAFLAFKLFDLSLKKKDFYKIGIWILLFLLLINPISISSSLYGLFDEGIVNDFYEKTINQARGSGLGYNRQWQEAGGWVRENTPKDAVFAHWWDYGYWVQTGFERATVTDGGNAKSSLNYNMGRHFLMGQNEIEALEFLKAHNVTHTLIVSEEIGKYPAFSSIGADENWDRYSWINVLTRNDAYTQETRNGTVFLFTGGIPLDWDFVYKGELYPKGAAGIAAVALPNSGVESGTIQFSQPYVIMINGERQENIPLECLYINGKEIIFPEEGIKGCFVIIPAISENKIDPLFTGIYISEKVRNTLFYKMYLTSQEMEYFKLVYTDEQNMPLSIFNGRIIGPLKIWEVSYPEDLEVPEIYYTDNLPDSNVESVKGRY